MNYEALEQYLTYVGENERDEIRAFLTNPVIDYPTRHYMWHVMADLSMFLSGFFWCIAIVDSPEKAEYYKEFFDQARSKEGLDQ